MGRGRMAKMIGFRPTEEIEQAIDDLVKTKQAKTKSDAVNLLIKRGLKKQAEPSQLEQLPQKREAPSTGIILECPLRSLPLRQFLGAYEHIVGFSEEIYWKTPVDSSICKTCPKYPCEAWRWIESERRLGIQEAYHEVLRKHGQLPLPRLNQEGV